MSNDSASAEQTAEESRPNIILILADDMGFSDIGCYGAEIQTPNLDRLGNGGIRFSQMYNYARCCPTRASLLTGVHPHQAGVGHMTADHGIPGYRGHLTENCATIAEVLSGGGYRCFMSGKWHVGGDYALSKSDAWTPGAEGFPRPVDRGFEHHFGTLTGAGSFFNPHALIQDHDLIEPEDDDFYYTDAITDNAVEMLNRYAGKGGPVFLAVTYTAPHWPLHAFDEDIEKYRGAYSNGWDAIRTARHENLKGLGLVDSKWPISPRDDLTPPWNEVSEQDWEAARMAVYAAQIDRMDQGIGNIVAKLGDLGIRDDTLIMFLSDNGGCAEFLAEEGRIETAPTETRDGRAVRSGNGPSIMPGPDDTYQSYDISWANVSNTPFRLFKRWVHEGGISTPFIANWPDVIAPNQIYSGPAQVIDIMATCVDASGASYPSDYNGNAIHPMEGESLMRAFRDGNWSREREIFWEHEGNRAVRQGNWKLVSELGRGWELYDIDEDRTELNDLATSNAAKARELENLYEQWAERIGVVPWEQIQQRIGTFNRISHQDRLGEHGSVE